MLFVQGSRDTFGTPSELSPVLAGLAPAPTLHVVAGGDHSLKVSRRDPEVQAAVYDDVQRTIVRWMQSVIDTDGRARAMAEDPIRWSHIHSTGAISRQTEPSSTVSKLKAWTR